MSDNSINDEDNKCSLNPSISDPPSLLPELHVADSGATANFGTLTLPVKNRRPTTNPIHIRMPNGAISASTHEGELDWPDIPEAARKIHLVPDFADQSLISMGVFCDAGCEAHFTASTVTITHQDRIVLTGTRTPSTRLWHLQPPQLNPKLEQACGAIGSVTPAEIVAFTHAALFSPALSTLENALTKGFLTNFPGMTLAQVRKHPPRSIPGSSTQKPTLNEN